MTQAAVWRAAPWASAPLALLAEATTVGKPRITHALALLQRLTAWRIEVLRVLDSQLAALAATRPADVPQPVFRPLWSERLTMLLSMQTFPR